MKPFFLVCCFLFSGFFSGAQNLVLNPGFEEWDSLYAKSNPEYTYIARSMVHYWYNPTTGTPDCFSNNFDVAFNKFPFENFGGKAEPHSGNCFAGFIPYSGTVNAEYREYIMGQFSSPFEKGKSYTISFYIQAGKNAKYGVKEMQICFFPKFPGKIITDEALQAKSPNVNVTLPDFDSNKGEWMKVTLDYVSSGNELFFIIGNFAKDNKTDIQTTANVTKHEHGWAYYYLDDFSVLSEDNNPETDTAEIEIVNVIETPKDTLGIVAGKTLVVDNVYFETDKSVLKEESFPVLDEIIAEMKNQPGLNVEIDGHTDSDGSAEHNLKLSKDRAKSVMAYFVSQGIDASRISTNGFGSTMPVSADKNKNRRVEFVFSE